MIYPVLFPPLTLLSRYSGTCIRMFQLCLTTVHQNMTRTRGKDSSDFKKFGTINLVPPILSMMVFPDDQKDGRRTAPLVGGGSEQGGMLQVLPDPLLTQTIRAPIPKPEFGH